MNEIARANPPLIAARTFEAAARLGSFKFAAEELFVTPAAVSHQVKRLEEYLGVVLFTRQNRNVVLTDAGVLLAQQLRSHFVELEKLLCPKRSHDNVVLKVTSMPSLAAKWLARRLPKFNASYPQIEVFLSDDDVLTEFSDGRFDLALRYGRGSYPGMKALPWMRASLVAVCSSSLPKSSAHTETDLFSENSLIHDSTPLLPGKPPGWPEWLAAAGFKSIDGEKGPRFSSIYIALEAACTSGGIALAPEPLVRDDIKAGRLQLAHEFELKNPFRFWIIHPEAFSPSPSLQIFIDWLLESGGKG